MRTHWPRAGLVLALALAGCGQGTEAGNNAALANDPIEQASNHCTPPALSLPDGSPLQSSLLDQSKANLAKAIEHACAKGILKDKGLFDPKAAVRDKLFLVNAPEANIASIYLSEIDGNRMVLEYPFLTIDGKSQLPSADELEEAIYCAVVGATPEEQERTGRCLPD